jgi:hypothetical protein
MTLRYALEMLGCLLFDLYIRRDSTPHPLLQLAFALKDKVDGVPSLLLDGEARYGERQPYSKEAYHRLQGEAAGIVEGLVQHSEFFAKLAKEHLKLGIKELRPIEAARLVAATLVDAGFIARGRGQGLHQASDPVERLAQTIKKWRNKAKRGTADFQRHYLPPHAMSVGLLSNAKGALEQLADLCRHYRVDEW